MTPHTDMGGSLAGVVLWAAVLVGALWLATQRWFWALVFGLGMLAAAFTTLACIVNFEILGAMLAFGLAAVCFFITGGIVIGSEWPDRQSGRR